MAVVSTDDQVEKTWKTWERCVVVKKNRVVKREIHEREFVRLPSGETVSPYWAKERLRNEAATIEFVSSRTSIPVPKCRLYTNDDGLLCLETTCISNGVLMLDLEGSSRAAAIEAVDEQIKREHSTPTPLPAPDVHWERRLMYTLPVFPPQRVYDRDRRQWPRISSSSVDFVLCHNDLGPQNIFVEPDTFNIVGIIDWEFAGFFPPSFELPLWRERSWADGKKMVDEARAQELRMI